MREPTALPEFTQPKDQPLPRILKARELFEGRQEIVIDHEGVQYRLRITRRNKLILQK